MSVQYFGLPSSRARLLRKTKVQSSDLGSPQGMFPSLGQARQKRTTIIIEDVALSADH